MNVVLIYMNQETNVGRGAGYIAGSIIRQGHHLTFFDTLDTSLQQISSAIQQGAFDIIMISSMTMLFPKALKLINMVKKHTPIPVLVGGIHATIMGKDLLAQHEEIDYLCVGEGESMVAEFLHDFRDDKRYKVDNLAYRKDKQIIQNPIRQAEDLAALCDFPWQLFSSKSIIQERDGWLYVDATRGCPFNCSYCCNGVYLSHYGKNYLRHKPIEHVIKELHWLKKTYHPKLFYFGDEIASFFIG